MEPMVGVGLFDAEMRLETEIKSRHETVSGGFKTADPGPPLTGRMDVLQFRKDIHRTSQQQRLYVFNKRGTVTCHACIMPLTKKIDMRVWVYKHVSERHDTLL